MNHIIETYKLTNMINCLCTISDASHSVYYRYFSTIAIENRKSNEVKDLEIKEILLKAYNFKRRKNMLSRLE